MIKTVFALSIIIFFLVSCTGKTQQQPVEITERDTSITIQNAFNELFLDSAAISDFVVTHNFSESMRDRIFSFYNSRNYQYAWFDSSGLAENTKAFWSLQQRFIDETKDSTLHDQWLHNQMLQFLEEDFKVSADNKYIQKTELELTHQFFDYAQNAYAGKIDPAELEWFIPRKKINMVELLDSLIKSKGNNIEQWEPVNGQYRLLKKELMHLYEIEKKQQWDSLFLSGKTKLVPGDSDKIIRQIKLRLHSFAGLSESDTSNYYTPEMEDAVSNLQRRFGLKDDGVIGAQTISILNISVKTLIEKIIINLERMRWLPNQEKDYVMVNIPEFKLYMFENGKQVFDMNVVVGKQGSGTQIFSDHLKYVVFSPYWNVPKSIVKNEILPAMNRNPNYLETQNMEITGEEEGLPVIRQKPGINNALGKVKFIFPNSYNIYFHDTPARSLFSRDKRAFSHGCIRLSDPFKMAQYLLRNDPQWTEEKIDSSMNADKEKWIGLKKPLPVLIAYFTAWIDDNGILHFSDDIYGHDARMAEKLFNKN
jgi:L,D-transpeptidase YcbB